MKIHHTEEQSAEEKAASKKGKAAVKKGKREKEVLDLWRAALEPIKAKVWATRMSQFKGGDKRPDINIHATGNLSDQYLHTETKHDENISLREAFMQAVRDCKSGVDPVACVKRFREPRIGVVWYDDLMKYQLAWLKENLKEQTEGE